MIIIFLSKNIIKIFNDQTYFNYLKNPIKAHLNFLNDFLKNFSTKICLSKNDYHTIFIEWKSYDKHFLSKKKLKK